MHDTLRATCVRKDICLTILFKTVVKFCKLVQRLIPYASHECNNEVKRVINPTLTRTLKLLAGLLKSVYKLQILKTFWAMVPTRPDPCLLEILWPDPTQHMDEPGLCPTLMYLVTHVLPLARVTLILTDDLDTWPWPIYSVDVPAHRKWPNRLTDTQTDATKCITTPHSRVIIVYLLHLSVGVRGFDLLVTLVITTKFMLLLDSNAFRTNFQKVWVHVYLVSSVLHTNWHLTQSWSLLNLGHFLLLDVI